MTDPLSTDFFSSLEQCNFPLPSLSRPYDLFPQFDPSTFIAPLDLPDHAQSSSTSSGSDNESHSPSTPLQVSSPLSSSPGYPLSTQDTSIIGAKRKLPDAHVTLPGVVVQDLMKSQEEKKSRLARKAELARQSRRKKKMRLCDLETEVAELQGELAAAKEEIKRLTTKNSAPQTCSNLDQMIEEILKWKGPSLMCPSPALNNMMIKKENKSPSELKIEQLVPELMLAVAKDPLVVNTLVQTMEHTLVPNMAIQFLEWTLTRGEQFYSEGTQFGHLFHETMQSTPQQLLALLALRKPANEDFKVKDAKVTEAMEVIKQALQQRAQQVDTFAKLRAIFTPQQLATYLQYVKMFGHVLIKVPA